jgi:hypothetical protein
MNFPIVGPTSLVATAEPSAPVLPMQLIERALAQGSLELVERFLQLQERYEAAQARKAFEAAMAAARAELPVIIKTRDGANGSYKYEDMATIARAVDPVLARHGLSYRFRTKSDDKRLTVTCIVSHAAGYSEENSLSAVVAPNSRLMSDIQAIGSAQTYLQRYTIKAALGLAAGRDDDAAVSVTRPNDNGGGDGELLSKEQMETLEAALVMRDMPVARLIKWIRVAYRGAGASEINEISDIPKHCFKQCLDKIQRNNTAEAAA